MLTSFDVNSFARQTFPAIGVVCVAFTPLQVSPAWNCSSAVRLLRSIAGCPFTVIEYGAHKLFGSVTP